MTGPAAGLRSGLDRARAVLADVRRRPDPARALVVIALVHAAALAGVVWWTVVAFEVVADGVAPGILAVLVVGAVAVAVVWAVLTVGVWRGREDARDALWRVAWVWVWTTALLSLHAFFAPLVLTAVAGYTVWYSQQEDLRAWTAVSPAPGPGSPPR